MIPFLINDYFGQRTLRDIVDSVLAVVLCAFLRLNDLPSLVRFSDAYDELGKNIFRETENLSRVLSPECAYHAGRETHLMNRKRYRHRA